MSKRCRCFYKTVLPLSVKLSSFDFLQGLTVSPISSSLITEVYEVLFLLFLQGTLKLSGFTLAKSSPCPDKPETLKFSLSIFISEGFSILVLLLDKLFFGDDLDLSIVSGEYLDSLTVSFDVFDFFVSSTVSIFLFMIYEMCWLP